MDFGAVVDGSVPVRGVLGFLGGWVVKLGEELGDVVVHRQAAGAFVVVPGEVDAGVEVAFLVDGDFIVFAEGVEEVIGVAFAYVFDPKIIHDEGEDYWAPLVPPEPGSHGTLIVVVVLETLFKEFVGEAAGLGKAVDAVADLEVDPSVVDEVIEIIFVDEVLRDVGEPDLAVLGIIERRCEVVVSDVVAYESGAFARENTVEEKFTKVKGRGFGSGVAIVHTKFAHDGDARSVGVVFLRAKFADDSGCGDATAAIKRDILVVNGAKGVGAFYALPSAVRASAETLTEAA